LGFEARELTPRVARKIVVLGAETRSFKRAVIALREAEVIVSEKTVGRVLGDTGRELTELRDAAVGAKRRLSKPPLDPPELAVVECDGGRVRCRQPDKGPGVHLEGKGWRESKIACLIRGQRRVFDEDPQPDPPECFLDPQHVAKIAETEALSVAAPTSAEQVPRADDKPETLEESPPAPDDWRPKRVVRTVLASLANSLAFGRQMKREAQSRRFFEAAAKAFLGDGLPWNWSIWKRRFPDFVPILDFIHALSYLFVAARAMHALAGDAWDQYRAWMTGCWRGEVDQVLEELRAWQARLGLPPRDVPDNDPREIARRTIQYLGNNRSRMNYPEYRRQGLPITTAWMESLVKEINYRVKGTEMFWNDPQGAEAILQVRAAALCDDGRLAHHMNTRPGRAFTRRPKSTKPTRQNCKS
jgi:hypothetical protein